MTDIIIQKKNEVYLEVNAEPHVLRELSEYFTFTVENSKWMPTAKHRQWNGDIHLFDNRNNTIYSGLLYRVCDWAENVGYTWAFKDNKFYGLPHEEDERVSETGVRMFMKNIMKGLEPRDYQVIAVYEALRFNRKTILSPTASGKSAIIYSITRYHVANNRRVLIIVPSTSLVEQMTKDFEDYGWDTDEHVHKIYSGKEHNTNSDVVVSTWQSLTEHTSKYFEQFDSVIVDEVHGAKSRCLVKILKNCRDIKYRYGLTGTLDGIEVNKLVIEGLFGPVYRVVKTKELMDAGYLASLDVQIINLKHQYRTFGSYNDEIEYLIECESRNRFLANLASDLSGNNLIFFTRVDTHGVPLCEMIREHTDRPVYLIHGGVDVEMREQIRNIVETTENAIIVASYGTMSTGVNIKRLNNVIFGSPSKSRIRVLQSIGRGLRKAHDKNTVKLYDISDDFGYTNFTQKHMEERVKMYIQEGFEYQIFDVDLNSK